MRWLFVFVAMEMGCVPQPPVSSVDPAAGFNAGQSAVSDGDMAVAYNGFARSAELSGAPKAHFNAGLASESLGHKDRAVEHYRSALAADPAYLNAAVRLGNLLVGDEQLTFLRSFLGVNPHALGIRIAMAGALARRGDQAGSQEQAEIVLRADPESVALYRELASAYLESGALSLGQLYASRARELGGDDASLINDAGVRLLKDGSTVDAVTRFQHALSLQPGHIPANMNLGWVALHSGDHGQARKRFERALQEDPSNIDARLGVAISARMAGDFKTAKRVYRAILDDEPGHMVAEANLMLLMAHLDEITRVKTLKAEAIEKVRRDGQKLGTEVAQLREILEAAACLEDAEKASHELLLETAVDMLSLESAETNDQVRQALKTYGDGIRSACQ